MINRNLERFKQSIKGKDTAVIGIGVSNTPLIKMLVSFGANVTAFDKKDKAELGEVYGELEKLGVRFCLGENYLDGLNHDTIFKTPGMRYDLPQLLKAREKGSIITSEMEIFFEVCPAPIIAVTGSDGKTTTTTLIYELLKNEGYTCHLGGNIGAPLLDKIHDIQPDHKVIIELSSFQLHTMNKSPHIAVVTNVTPNHLDMHKSMEEYIEAKENICKYQTDKDRVILNYDNNITNAFSKTATNPLFFSRLNELEHGIYLENKIIKVNINGKVEEMLNTNDIFLPGTHNVENYMAAIGATYGMVSQKTIVDTAKNFKGVPHRIEFVHEINGVKYFNDSIASTPARTTAGLNSFDQKVVLIAGGYDKQIPFDDFGNIINDKVKTLILLGATAPKIESAVRNAPNFKELHIINTDSLENAVNVAKSTAKNGDIVILSPACASFDMFKNFEERGNTFKQLVKGN